MDKKSKHMPKNSIFLVIKFRTNSQLIEFLENEAFQLYKSKLECIAVQKGGKCQFQINNAS